MAPMMITRLWSASQNACVSFRARSARISITFSSFSSVAWSILAYRMPQLEAGCRRGDPQQPIRSNPVVAVVWNEFTPASQSSASIASAGPSVLITASLANETDDDLAADRPCALARVYGRSFHPRHPLGRKPAAPPMSLSEAPASSVAMSVTRVVSGSAFRQAGEIGAQSAL
jgi:hypothetical protein